MVLKKYNDKRDFRSTSEPPGRKRRGGKKLHFVVQRHAASRLHYDFRLEVDGVLKSWAIPKGPSLNASDKRLAMMVEDHPLEYRTFEGTIPQGNYGAGEVEIWDKGYYVPLTQGKGENPNKVMREEINNGSLKFVLHGEKLQGEFALVKIKDAKQENAWLLIKHKDEFSVKKKYSAEDYISSDSKVTAYLDKKKKAHPSKKVVPISRAKNYKKTEKDKFPEIIKPMLCKIEDTPFDSKEWAFEIKWDGYRAIADLRGTKVKLYSRNGKDFTSTFSNIANALQLQVYDMVLDGEIIAYDAQGKPSFQRLQNMEEENQQAVVFQVFDLLWLNGHSTMELTYLQRKELLSEALQQHELIQYHDFVLEKGKKFFEQARRLGLEGIIAKRVDSSYTPQIRSSEWLKIKVDQTDEVLICGFTAPKGSRKHFGSLVLGKFSEGQLVFCGHVGTGFKDKDLEMLARKMKRFIRKTSPFPERPKINGKTTWLTPKLVAEIKFTELTKELIYRHPVFMHLRKDKRAEEVDFNMDKMLSEVKPSLKMKSQKNFSGDDKLLRIGRHKVKITNPDKVYFPQLEITKGMVMDYYQQMAPYILPHLKNRPQSMNRFPNGIEGQNFYQKDAADETPAWIATESIFSESTDKNIEYLVCNDKASLAYLNNLGCIELNPWTSKISDIECPTYMVLDLDPSENNNFDDVIEVALVVKEVLDDAKVKGYPKTSGSSGMHIYVPMGNKYPFAQVKDFAHLLMQLVQTRIPELTTLERSLKKRDKGKIYLDYLQNRRGQTLASVYSLRPRKEGTISMPLEWHEVKKGLKPTDFTVFNALDRVKEKGDLFKPVLGRGANILQAIKRLEKL